MCGASEDESKEGDNRPKMDEDYILKPFPNDQFIPDTWQDILANVDVCVNKVTPPTVFCDEEGFDIIPIQMVKVIYEGQDGKKGELESTTPHQELNLLDKVSIQDRSKKESESLEDEKNLHNQVFYDASSDELEDFQE